MTDDSTPLPSRRALRRQLLLDREKFSRSPGARSAQQAFSAHLIRVLNEIEPELLGVYWPIRNEFNAIHALGEQARPKFRLALPYARREPHEMHYRVWDGEALVTEDEWGLPSPQGTPVVPDVVLAPCLGYTRSGFRLGYGAGYFDRWLALHPHVTAIGVAWSVGEIGEGDFQPQSHDHCLTLLVTEHGVIG